MTPAISAARKAKITHQVHEYVHDPASESYGTEAVEKLGLPADRVFKTLVVSVDNKELVVGVVSVSSMLSMKSLAKAVGAKKAAMATPSAFKTSPNLFHRRKHPGQFVSTDAQVISVGGKYFEGDRFVVADAL